MSGLVMIALFAYVWLLGFLAGRSAGKSGEQIAQVRRRIDAERRAASTSEGTVND